MHHIFDLCQTHQTGKLYHTYKGHLKSSWNFSNGPRTSCVRPRLYLCCEYVHLCGFVRRLLAYL